MKFVKISKTTREQIRTPYKEDARMSVLLRALRLISSMEHEIKDSFVYEDNKIGQRNMKTIANYLIKKSEELKEAASQFLND